LTGGYGPESAAARITASTNPIFLEIFARIAGHPFSLRCCRIPQLASQLAWGLVVAAQLAAELLAKKKTVAQLGFRVDHVTEHLFPPPTFFVFSKFSDDLFTFLFELRGGGRG